MVSPGEWGPTTWKLLHGIAERVGQHDNMTLLRDEQNEIRLTLKHFAALLPCLKCQGHYREWIKNNPPEQISGKFGIDIQEALRDWVFRLHEDVNARRDVVSGIDPATLPDMYGAVNLRECASVLKSMYKRAGELRIFKHEEWKLAWKHLDLLLRSIA